MSDWPDDTIAGIPRPDLVAAWWETDTLPTDCVPVWAAHWLVAGYDGDALVTLAGLPGSEPREVRDILPAALRECGVSDLGQGAATEHRERANVE